VRILYFGTYERDYPRNTQVISCLRDAGVEVVEHNIPVWDGREHKLGIGPAVAAKLGLAELRLLRRPEASFDAVVVGYPGHLDLGRARRAAGARRPLVFNPLVSLEDTLVSDRGLVSSSSFRARVLRSIDRRAFRAADLVIADTEAHADYFRARFELPPDRVAVCLVGAEDRVFTPGERADDLTFSVLFVGKLIPLHGIETILMAARICEEIPFSIVGSGQLDPLVEHAPANVRWDRWVEYEQLADLYRGAGCALGIFGLSDKATRVIPNKAYQALATQTALVTSDTPGARELLEDGRDALLVAPGDAEALAAAIRRLAADESLRAAIAERGRATYVARASEAVLGARWRCLMELMVRRRARGER
jgi:glycosyltransferase involved in cell wall biosynthesis